jgi:hypothetical protein
LKNPNLIKFSKFLDQLSSGFAEARDVVLALDAIVSGHPPKPTDPDPIPEPVIPTDPTPVDPEPVIPIDSTPDDPVPVDPIPIPVRSPTLRIITPEPASTVDNPVRVAFAIDGDITRVSHGHLSIDGQPETRFDPQSTEFVFSDVKHGYHVLTGSLSDLDHATIVGSLVRVEFTVRAPDPEPLPLPEPEPPTLPVPEPEPPPVPTDTGHDHGKPPGKPTVPPGKPFKSFDFGPAGSAVAADSIGVGLDLYTPGRGHGWAGVEGLGVLDDGGPDLLTRDMVYGPDGTFLVDVPDGTYTVVPTLGHRGYKHDDISIWCQGIHEVSGLKTAAGEFVQPAISAVVTDGRLKMRFADQGPGSPNDPNFTLCGISIYRVSDSIVADRFGTGHDTFPNFCVNPTAVSVASGVWSDPDIWSGGQVPAVEAVVVIARDTKVQYDVVPARAVPLLSVGIESRGVLIFRDYISTRLLVRDLLVMPGGELSIGTLDNPIDAAIRAEVIFRDISLDASLDPDEAGGGLIGLGKVTVHGAVVSSPFIRLAAEPRAGHGTLTLSQPADGWRPGDVLLLSDTRQLRESERWGNYVPHWERPVVRSVSSDGLTVYLTSPLRFDHRGSRDDDGKQKDLPHVANLTRNVVFRSENPDGHRGHVIFSGGADVDVRGAEFFGLGRTRLGWARREGRIGRYAVHFHRLDGHPGRPETEPQFRIQGCAVWDDKDIWAVDPQTPLWGLVTHNSHYGLIGDNIVHNKAGAGIVTEDGNETHNVFERNFVCGIRGNSNPRSLDGLDGTGFWLHGFGNIVRDNFVSACMTLGQGIVTGTGYYIWTSSGHDMRTRVPRFPGADLNVAGQYDLVDQQLVPIREFARNETYGGCSAGMTLWHVGTDGYGARLPAGSPGSVIRDFRAWHCWEEGFFGYPTQNLTFDGFTVRGDPAVAGAVGWTHGDYWGGNVTIRRADIRGVRIGIDQGSDTPCIFTIEDCDLRCLEMGIRIGTLQTPGSAAPMPPRRTIIRNCRFAGPGTIAIAMSCQLDGVNLDLVQKDEVYVEDFNGVKGDNFRVYYIEQHADFIVPISKPQHSMVGAPEADLSNRECWEKHGIAVAGAVAPADAVKRPGIVGLVVPQPKIESGVDEGLEGG